MARERPHLAVRAGESHEPRADAATQAVAASQGDLEPDRQGEAKGLHADPSAAVFHSESRQGRGGPRAWQAAVRQARSDRGARGEAGDRASAEEGIGAMKVMFIAGFGPITADVEASRR